MAHPEHAISTIVVYDGAMGSDDPWTASGQRDIRIDASSGVEVDVVESEVDESVPSHPVPKVLIQ